MVKNNSSSPTIIPGVAHGFSSQPRVNRPAGAGRLNPGKSVQAPGFRTPRGFITGPPVTGARPEPTALGVGKARHNSQPTKGKGSPKSGPGGNGNGAVEFDDTCPAPNKEQLQTHKHDFTQKSKNKKKKKKKRNQHLNRQIEVNSENFEFERDKIEKKAPSHGTEFGLEPDYGPDGKIIRDRKTGKPRAKQTKENYLKFTDNLSEFVQDPKSERIEPQYRKGRENEQDAVGFLNRRDRRFVIFNRHTKKYITGWVMNDLQYQEFIDNNNII